MPANDITAKGHDRSDSAIAQQSMGLPSSGIFAIPFRRDVLRVVVRSSLLSSAPRRE